MTRSFPILRIASVEASRSDSRGVVGDAELAGLGRRLETTDFTTPSAPVLMAGWIPETADGLLMTDETRLEPLAYWCSNVGARGYASLLALTADGLGAPEGIAAHDFPLLTGHGVVLASRGASGEPLVGKDVAELRGELETSRRRLSQACGYPVRALAPRPTVAGRAFDGLVLREARRAGYRLFLGPGGVAEVEGVAPTEVLEYRTRETGEGPDELLDWLLGRGLARGTARVRRLASAPRTMFDRLVPDS